MVDAHEPVVVGVDGSEKAVEAARLAAAEAATRGVSLHIVHATALDGRSGKRPDPADQLLLDYGQDVLDEAIAQVAAQVHQLCVTSTLSRDSAVRALLGAAGADGIIVVGSRGLGGFSALLLGSVGLRLAARVTGPLIVVRGAPEPVRTGVVLAAARDEGDLDALRFAAETADRHKASLRVLSCYRFHQYAGSMVPMRDDLTEVPEEQVRATSRLLGFLRDAFPALTVTADAVRAPSTAGALIDASGHADLLVIGARRPAHAIGAPLGHVAHAALHHAQCPVAMVPCRGPRGGGG
ncbi:universal stress protein [Streptomyces siamensis]|uniref:Universal stress protein n=1 Tax=Streptomyces siamensis TaxID=1274986 RepID=A0ABP9J663_9ACTN